MLATLSAEVAPVVMSSNYDPARHYPVTVPCGTIGTACVDEFLLTKKEADHANVMGRFSSGYYRHKTLTPGLFKRLRINGEVFMSNTRMEYMTNREFINAAEGDILITGLGLGATVEAILKSRRCGACPSSR
jgi:hypothetical protein